MSCPFAVKIGAAAAAESEMAVKQRRTDYYLLSTRLLDRDHEKNFSSLPPLSQSKYANSNFILSPELADCVKSRLELNKGVEKTGCFPVVNALLMPFLTSLFSAA